MCLAGSITPPSMTAGAKATAGLYGFLTDYKEKTGVDIVRLHES